MKSYRGTLTALLLLVCLSGCDPTRFMIAGKNPIQCRIYTPLGTIEHSESTVLVKDGGCFSLGVYGVPEYRITMYTRLLAGDGYAIMLRPLAEETLIDSGLTLFLSTSHSRLDSAGTLVEDMPGVHLRQDSTELITIISECHYLQVTIGCDTILRRNTTIIEPSNIAISAEPKSKTLIMAPSWNVIPE